MTVVFEKWSWYAQLVVIKIAEACDLSVFVYVT